MNIDAVTKLALARAPVRNLSVLAYANGFTMWHFKVPNGDWENVERAGYFSDFGDMLTAGDMMVASSAQGGATFIVVGHGEAIAVEKMMGTEM